MEVPSIIPASMIRFLSVKQLAIVEALEIEFEPGLTVLTGETGAGKSIVLGALGLLVGTRATPDLVRIGADRAIVQATVETTEGREIILRREVTAQGRSRAFIDDTLATVGALQELGGRLVDFHGQHEHQALLNPQAHLSLLDVHTGDAKLTATVAGAFREWRSAATRLEQAVRMDRDRDERLDLLTFQREEIDSASPVVGEDDALVLTRTRLGHADRLSQLCAEAYDMLYESDTAVLSALGPVWQRLEELAALDPTLSEPLAARQTVGAQIEDLAFSLRSYAATIDRSPGQLTEVEARLETLHRLKKKYGPRLQDVVDHRNKIEGELDALARHAERIALLTEEESRAREQFVRAAATLSDQRRAAAARLSAELRPVFKRLALPHAVFEVAFGEQPLTEERWSESGVDQVEFRFSANPGEAGRPLARVASGGELSRVMLGLKTLATTDAPGKTLVFDEIDAGIGGATADMVGQMLARLADRFQVICVTHLPQIAAYASSHHHVSKVVRDGRSVTVIEALAEEGRVAEIARLMTGGASDRAVGSARELLASKQNAKGERERRKRKA